MGDILVTGASGKVGRHVVEQLVEQGERGVRAAGRHPRAPAGASAVTFDWLDESTWAEALRGVDRVYVTPSTESEFDPSQQVLSFLGRAEEAGVERVVLLSAMGMQHAPEDVPVRAVELGAQRTGMTVTVLRPNWFDQNLDAGVFVPAMVGQGRLPAPTGGARVSFVDTRDIAAVAVAALTQDGHGGRAYTLTGPEALTFTEVARTLSDVWGRPIEHDDVTPPQMEDYLRGAGLPDQYARLLTGMMGAMKQGSAEPVTEDVETVTGSPARSLRDYAETTPAPWAA